MVRCFRPWKFVHQLAVVCVDKQAVPQGLRHSSSSTQVLSNSGRQDGGHCDGDRLSYDRVLSCRLHLRPSSWSFCLNHHYMRHHYEASLWGITIWGITIWGITIWGITMRHHYMRHHYMRHHYMRHHYMRHHYEASLYEASLYEASLYEASLYEASL